MVKEIVAVIGEPWSIPEKDSQGFVDI
jgi:hypothetical protein